MDRRFASNDHSEGYKEHEDQFNFNPAVGNFTADVTGQVLFIARAAGSIQDVILGAVENGADGTDPLNLDADVLINAVSALTTKPKLDKAAGTGSKSTAAAGTGITVAAVNSAANTFAKGDIVTVTLNITRTTPETEMASPSVAVVVRYDADAAPNVSLSS